MKKAVPYIILGVVLVAISFLLFTGGNEKNRQFDPRVTLRKNDKIPYGTFIAYENLKYLFPNATISSNKKEPIYWDSLSNYDTNQALIIVSHRFFADESEMERILRFAESGNDVFISSMVVAEDVKSMLRCSISYFDLSEIFAESVIISDSLAVSLSNPPFSRSYNYTYPGQRFDSHFFKIDTSTSTVLGNGQAGQINFIHLKAGDGNVYFHLAPLTFSNYFLLQRSNMTYYENILSVIPPNVKRVVWDEYYLNKRYYYEKNEGSSRSGWLNTFMKYGSLKWALITAMLTLLVYVLFEMRRKQRYIPVVSKPRNDSLEFVKTIGRLYFEKGDHVNLARKMSAYFREYVRNKYKLTTSNLNDEFINKLQFKTGVPEGELKVIASMIGHIETGGRLNDKQLADFHKQLEIFYQKA